MKRTFNIQLLKLMHGEKGNPYGGDPIVYETKHSKKAAIAFIKKGVKRNDVFSGWIDEDTEDENPFRAFIYKGDADITDQTNW
jgi:hypothetical protein